MNFGSAQAKGAVHALQGPDAIIFSHDAAGADFAGGNHLDVDARLRQGPEHAGGRAWGTGHAGTDSTHPRDRLALFKPRAWPLA